MLWIILAYYVTLDDVSMSMYKKYQLSGDLLRYNSNTITFTTIMSCELHDGSKFDILCVESVSLMS